MEQENLSLLQQQELLQEVRHEAELKKATNKAASKALAITSICYQWSLGGAVLLLEKTGLLPMKYIPGWVFVLFLMVPFAISSIIVYATKKR